MPRNLPRMNDGRPMGFDSTVRAVRPSISSLIEVLAAHTARIDAEDHDQRQSRVLQHLDVFAERVVRDPGEEDHQQHRAHDAMIENSGWAISDLYVARAMAEKRGAANR